MQTYVTLQLTYREGSPASEEKQAFDTKMGCCAELGVDRTRIKIFQSKT